MLPSIGCKRFMLLFPTYAPLPPPNGLFLLGCALASPAVGMSLFVVTPSIPACRSPPLLACLCGCGYGDWQCVILRWRPLPVSGPGLKAEIFYFVRQRLVVAEPFIGEGTPEPGSTPFRPSGTVPMGRGAGPSPTQIRPPRTPPGGVLAHPKGQSPTAGLSPGRTGMGTLLRSHETWGLGYPL